MPQDVPQKTPHGAAQETSQETPHVLQPGDSAPRGVTVADRLAAIRERIARAARRAGRDPGSIVLIGVSKGVAPEVIREAVAAGLTDLGENRVQEARDKKAQLEGDPLFSGVRWHLVGHLQTNKVNAALRLFDVIHSWDRPAVMEAISQRAVREGRIVEGFVQVNIGREPNKHGVDPDQLFDLLERCGSLPGLKIRGLMAIPPLADDPEASRPYFRRLRELAEEARRRGVGGFAGEELSMGMSDDFEVAIEEGATLVRVGRAIFGPRPGGG